MPLDQNATWFIWADQKYSPLWNAFLNEIGIVWTKCNNFFFLQGLYDVMCRNSQLQQPIIQVLTSQVGDRNYALGPEQNGYHFESIFKCIILKWPSPICKVQGTGWLRQGITEWHGSHFVNSLRASDAYMPHQRRPSSVQIMTWHLFLFGAKPLSGLMPNHCQLDS